MKQRCQWFVLCENEATHLKPHPILGDVPCCDRCAGIGESDPPKVQAKPAA